jgi:hypothetical protein
VWILGTAFGFLVFLWLEAHPTGSFAELLLVGGLLGAAALPPAALLSWVVRRPVRATQ